MKKILNFFKIKNAPSVIAGLALALVLGAGASLVQAQITNVVPFIGDTTSVRSRIGSLSVGSTTVPGWITGASSNCLKGNITEFDLQNNPNFMSCFNVSGQASVTNILVKQMANIGSFISGDSLGMNPSSDVFIVAGNSKVNGSVSVGGLKYVGEFGGAGFFNPRDYTTERNVCADASGRLQICTGKTPQNGVCGGANGGQSSSAPTSNLCTSGNASSVATNTTSNPTTYSWTCSGSNGGSTASCSSTQTNQPVIGQCGISDGGSFGSAPTSGLCSAGSATSVATGGQPGSETYSWVCNGANGGANDSCSASQTSSPVDGQCTEYTGTGIQGLQGYTTQPGTDTVSGCNVGNYNDTIDSSLQWQWQCLGQNGGATDSCDAPKQPVCENYPSSYTSQPATNTGNGCDLGVYTDTPDGLNTWRWSCTIGSRTTNCSASQVNYCGQNNGQTVDSIDELDADKYCNAPAPDPGFGPVGPGPLDWQCIANGQTSNCSATINGTSGGGGITYTTQCGAGCGDNNVRCDPNKTDPNGNGATFSCKQSSQQAPSNNGDGTCAFYDGLLTPVGGGDPFHSWFDC